MLSYLKMAGLAAGLLALLGSYVFAYHLGGASTRADAEAAHAAQLGAVVAELERQRNAALSESARRKGIIDAYDKAKDIPSPAVAGLAHRLYLYTASAGCGSVPGIGAVAGGAAPPAASAGSAGSAEQLSRLTQAVFDATDADSAQMNAMIQVASKPPP